MDEEELERPRKKITISNFFESIQSIDKEANRALKKTKSNLGIISKNKSLIEALSKSFDTIKTEIKEIKTEVKEYITIEKDLDKDKLFAQEDQEQKIKRLERLQGIEGDKVDPADAAAGTTDDSDFKEQAADTVKRALQDRGVMSIIVGLIGVNLASMLENKGSFFGGMADFATGNLFDFDNKGRGLTPILPEVQEKLREKPRGYGRIFGGISDYIMRDSTDFDKRGGNRPQNLNLGGEVKDNDNDTSNNNEDSVPAVLTPGEFVVTKDAVEKVGVDTLEGLNASVGATNKASNLGKFSIERLDPKDISKNTLIKKYSFADGVSDVEISNESGRDYFKSTTDMSTGGLNEKTVKRTRFTETSEDGTVTVFDQNTEMTEKIVSIGVPDLIEHKDQLLGEIHKLKGLKILQ